MNIQKMTDKELMTEYACYNPDCFNTKDVLKREMIAREIERRGFEIIEDGRVDFVKDNEIVEEFNEKGVAVI